MVFVIIYLNSSIFEQIKFMCNPINEKPLYDKIYCYLNVT